MLRIGQRLQEERLAKGLTLDEVSKDIKIKSSFLAAIEDGKYDKLPSSAYAQGFVSNYSQYLGVSKKEALALFRREFDEKKIYKVLPEGFSRSGEFPSYRIKLQQTALFGIVALVLLCAYLLYQYRYAFLNPPLDILQPVDKAVLSSPHLTVIGKTDPNAAVFVNNEVVFLNSDGEFTKQIDLFPGDGVLQIRAVNRFGKETRIERHVEVKL